MRPRQPSLTNSCMSDIPCYHVQHYSPPPRYPALAWQARAARRALHRVASVGTWLRERAALTRYAQMPLANLGPDPTVAVADIQLARSLRDANHLLWVKDPTLPDLGVEDTEDNGEGALSSGPGAYVSSGAAAMPTGAAAFAAPVSAAPAAAAASVGGNRAPEVLAPGAYRSISVELKLHHLAVAAIQQVKGRGRAHQSVHQTRHSAYMHEYIHICIYGPRMSSTTRHPSLHLLPSLHAPRAPPPHLRLARWASWRVLWAGRTALGAQRSRCCGGWWAHGCTTPPPTPMCECGAAPRWAHMVRMVACK